MQVRHTKSRLRRSLVAVAATLLLAWAVVFLLTPRGPVINVRWTSGLASAERDSVETALGLKRGQLDEDRTWSYQFLDPTTEHLRVLVSHPRVEDTGGFDRATLEPLAPSPGVVPRAVALTLMLWLSATLLRGMGRFLMSHRGWTSRDPLGAFNWNRIALVEIVLLTGYLGYWMFQIEFPYLDSFRTFDYVNRKTWLGLWTDTLSGTAEFRPLYFALMKIIHDFAGGPSLVVFRTIQLSLIILSLLLFRSLVQPREQAAWLGYSVGLCCLVGLHTSRITMATGFTPFMPLTVIVLVFASLLALRWKSGLRVDSAAAMMSLTAVLMVEYGIVVPMVWVTAGMWRMGSATRRTALFASGATGVYVALRLLTNAEPVPGPFYTETSFLFQENLTVEAQRALFLGKEWLFYLYNVSATLLTVLFSEPRSGLYWALDALVNGTQIKLWQLVNWVTSLLSTALIGLWVVKWTPHERETRRLLGLATAVILGNSMMGFLYTRDRIPVVAGTCYALLLALAVTALWKRRKSLTETGQHVVAVITVVLALGWGIRAVGLVVLARDMAWSIKDEWTDRFDRISPAVFSGTPPDDQRTDALREELRRRAADRSLPDPREDPDWTRQLFERVNF